MGQILATTLAILLMAASAASARSQESGQEREREHSKVITPDAPGLSQNHRLILKDGSYQVVRKYQMVGDRVRYMSMERGGEWEVLFFVFVVWVVSLLWVVFFFGLFV